MAENFWLVRPGDNNDIAAEILAQKAIAIAWPRVGDLSELTSRAQVKDRVNEAYPAYSTGHAQQATTQLFTFLSKIDAGDIVLAPFPQRKLWLGRVRGSYRFDVQAISNEYPHIREVEWLIELEDSKVSPAFRASIQSRSTIFSLQKWEADIRQLLNLQEPSGEESVNAQTFEEISLRANRKVRQLQQKLMGEPTLSVDAVVEGLTQIHFERFKAFDQRVEIDLAPVTVIAGVNSGGKSTVIQSLLLARQTLITPYRQTTENALEYDGELVRFSNFREMIFGKPSNYKGGMDLGFTIRSRHRSARLSRVARDNAEYQRRAVVLKTDLDVHFSYDVAKKIVVPSQVTLKSYLDSDQLTQPIITLTIKPEGSRWRFRLDMDQSRYTFSDDSLGFDRFIPVWRSTFLAKRPNDENELEAYLITRQVFSSFFQTALSLLQEELTERLFYMGPLRGAPQRIYLRHSSGGLDIGSGGEFTIQQLHNHWEEEVRFVDVPDNVREMHLEKLEPLSMKLSEAVSKALKLLGMEQQLKIERFGESYEASFSLLSKPKTYVFITEVGFGLSQILPIIALGLLSPTNSILIFEQPEIHLHPRAQAGLAEFFLCLALTGRRILVETHSDHLINRLRRRVAEDETNELARFVNVLFVRPPTGEGNGAALERAQINQYGDIENWPPGFLVEGAEDARAIMLAGSTKRLKEQRQERAG